MNQEQQIKVINIIGGSIFWSVLAILIFMSCDRDKTRSAKVLCIEKVQNAEICREMFK